MEKFNVIDVQGRKVISLTPDGKMRPAVLVDLESLKRLGKSIPHPDLYTQKHMIEQKIQSAENITEVLKVLEDESAYQDTVRSILMLSVEEMGEFLRMEQMFDREPA